MRAPFEPSCILSRNRLAYLAMLVGMLVHSVASPGSAAPTSRPAVATVEVGLVGPIAEEPTLPRRITSWFDRKRFLVGTRTVRKLDASRILSPEHSGTVYVWVTLGTDNVAHLYFATTSPSRGGAVYLMRDLPLRQGLDEMGSERIAQVLHMSTVAILEGQAETRREDVERKLQTDEANRSPQAPGGVAGHETDVRSNPSGETSPTSTEQRNFDIGVGYGLSFHADEGTWHGPRASFEFFVTQVFAVGALVRTAVPHSQDVDGISLSVEALSIEGLAGWHAQITAGISAVVYAGPGFDLVYHRPTQARNPDATLARGETEARPNLMAGVGVVVGQTFPRFAFMFDATALLSGTRYELVNGRSRRAMAQAAEFAPAFGIELRF